MTILNEQSRYDSTHHPSDEHLLKYFDGKLPELARENVQAHLIECDMCLETLKDLREFFESHREDEETINEDRLRSWAALWDKLRDAEDRAQLTPVASLAGRFRFKSTTAWALAAMLLVILGLGSWTIRQRQLQHRLTTDLQLAEQRTAQLQAEHDTLAARARELEQENLLLQEQARSKEQTRSFRRSTTTKPQLNAPIYDVYARNFTQRSGNQSEVNRLKVPASAESIILLLNADGLTPSSDYGVEIVNESGKIIWRARGLKKGQLGSLTLTLDRTFLEPGTFRLRLYGSEGWSSKAVAEYVVRIE